MRRLLLLAAVLGAGGLVRAKAPPPPVPASSAAERTLSVTRDADGGEFARFVELADGGGLIRFRDGHVSPLRLRRADCTADAGSFFPDVARGCARASDCIAFMPMQRGLPCCAAALRRKYEADAFDVGLAAAAATAHSSDGGGCGGWDEAQEAKRTCVDGCDEAVCVKGVCQVKETTFQ